MFGNEWMTARFIIVLTGQIDGLVYRAICMQISRVRSAELRGGGSCVSCLGWRARPETGVWIVQ